MAEETRRFGRTGEVYKVADGQWRWRLMASNGKVIANGGESFHNRTHVVKMVKSMGLMVKVREIAAPPGE